MDFFTKARYYSKNIPLDTKKAPRLYQIHLQNTWYVCVCVFILGVFDSCDSWPWSNLQTFGSNFPWVSVTLATAASTSGAASRASPATSSWKKLRFVGGFLVAEWMLFSQIFKLNYKKISWVDFETQKYTNVCQDKIYIYTFITANGKENMSSSLVLRKPTAEASNC